MITPTTAVLVLELFTLVLGELLVSEGTENETNHEKDTLRLVTVIVRHGERAPVDTYPNDPHIDSKMEPYGWGQLTNEGRRNQYDLGMYLRKRYNGFLRSMYSPGVFYLQTTAEDRTKMSGMLGAAALWKPNKKQMFRPDLAWQPVALHYQRREDDTLMLIWNTCPKYTQLRSSVHDLPEVQKMIDNNKELFKELTNFTGMPIATIEDVGSLYSTLTAEHQMGLALPGWTKNYYPNKLEPLMLYDLQLNTYNDEFRRLRGGPMLKKIVDEMTAQRNGSLLPKNRKMFMYVGHDSTIVAVLDAMRIWRNQMPHYNIMIMIELHEDEGEWNVQIFLKNTTTHEPYPIAIPGCTVACPLSDFVAILKPMTPDNWKEECKVEGDYTTPPAPLP